ncbi:hypothetical protein GCM10029978_075610 [Actinoallomurus acanthiterrae]
MDPDEMRGHLVQNELNRPEVRGNVPVDGFGDLFPLSCRRHEPLVPRLMPLNPSPAYLVHDQAL